jgi:hypothetical protein
MTRRPTKALLQAIAVTAEITGTELSEAAARVFASDLAEYPEDEVLGALTRARREVKGRLTVADVIGRLEDGRPSADEAWAMLPFNEDDSCVWSDEMAAAYGVVSKLMVSRDSNAARMAFRQAYEREVKKARDNRVRVHWFASLGRDATARAACLEDAVRKGRLTAAYATKLYPALPEVCPEVAALMAPVTQGLLTEKQ